MFDTIYEDGIRYAQEQRTHEVIYIANSLKAHPDSNPMRDRLLPSWKGQTR